MKINICMIVRDRPRHTRQAIESLIAHTVTPATLTIVDDGSEIETRKLIDKHLDGPFQVSVVHNRVPLGVGGAKNLAVKVSEMQWGRGDYLYLSDNDAFYTPKWDRALISAHASLYPTVQVLGGQNHPFHLPVRSWHTKSNLDVHAGNAVAGVSWLMTWDTWDKYGPFPDNARGVRQSEDWAVCQRIREDGFEVGWVDPPVVIDTGMTDTFGNLVPGYEHYEDRKSGEVWIG